MKIILARFFTTPRTRSLLQSVKSHGLNIGFWQPMQCFCLCSFFKQRVLFVFVNVAL